MLISRDDVAVTRPSFNDRTDYNLTVRGFGSIFASSDATFATSHAIILGRDEALINFSGLDRK